MHVCVVKILRNQWRSPGGTLLKKLPAMQETGLIPLSGRSPEKEPAGYPSVLAWEISWTEEPGGIQSMVSQESNTTQRRKKQHSILNSKMFGNF